MPSADTDPAAGSATASVATTAPAPKKTKRRPKPPSPTSAELALQLPGNIEWLLETFPGSVPLSELQSTYKKMLRTRKREVELGVVDEDEPFKYRETQPKGKEKEPASAPGQAPDLWRKRKFDSEYDADSGTDPGRTKMPALGSTCLDDAIRDYRHRHLPSNKKNAPVLTENDANIAHILKTYRVSFRFLSQKLDVLSRETELVNQLWYKNASQHKSAWFWASFDGLRRALHRLESTPSTRHLSLVFAGLGGGTEALTSHQGRLNDAASQLSLPKFDTKPTIEVGQVWIRDQGGLDWIDQTCDQLKALEKSLELVKRRARALGKMLVLHANTPPAPTFAPVITTLFALAATVASEAEACLTGNGVEETHSSTEESGESPIETFRLILSTLLDEPGET